ncbi:hypothetical protein M406DRAFT_320038 [Cryphonectria parasitica EP155]|uniref:Conidiation-specific protein 6 n=1 Tax=Cryphonectria parasitica (strain ATCC 38755 / EP155) TaxID=660469 RepID=A0A9P5CSW9_CRYP1|nr:uncharacterized protein M406DRAFT_320038 [Cryphonectria parasitica EP155]KAF3769713.1 hypothetical protein M406DRAFT_320038 [Cryphonectria parasitica EP155]
MPTEAHVIAGHKANIHNPNTSDGAKEHSKEVLKDEHNIIMDGDQAKNLSNVAAGLKGAMHNQKIPEDSQFAAAEKLGQVEQ